MRGIGRELPSHAVDEATGSRPRARRHPVYRGWNKGNIHRSKSALVTCKHKRVQPRIHPDRYTAQELLTIYIPRYDLLWVWLKKQAVGAKFGAIYIHDTFFAHLINADTFACLHKPRTSSPLDLESHFPLPIRSSIASILSKKARARMRSRGTAPPLEHWGRFIVESNVSS